jgi:hypothetical protein
MDSMGGNDSVDPCCLKVDRVADDAMICDKGETRPGGSLAAAGRARFFGSHSIFNANFGEGLFLTEDRFTMGVLGE